MAKSNDGDCIFANVDTAAKAFEAGRLQGLEEAAKIAEETTVTASGYYAGLYEAGGSNCAEKIAEAIREKIKGAAVGEKEENTQ